MADITLLFLLAIHSPAKASRTAKAFAVLSMCHVPVLTSRTLKRGLAIS